MECFVKEEIIAQINSAFQKAPAQQRSKPGKVNLSSKKGLRALSRTGKRPRSFLE